MKWLIILSAGLATSLIVANLLALKIWKLGVFPVDAGVLIFPLSYMTGDLLAEFYGEKIANFVALVAAVFGMLTLGVFCIAYTLPGYPGVDNSGFEAITTMAGRVFFASIVSFLLGQIANNRVFDAIRHKQPLTSIGMRRQLDLQAEPIPVRITDQKFVAAFAKRALVSSSAAHAVDAIVFEVIAFYGKLPFLEFLSQVVFAYLLGLVLELLIFPVTYFLAYKGHSAS